MSSYLKLLIRDIKQLPTLPSIVTEINRVVSDPDSGADDIREIISNDVAIASKVIKAVNTAQYAFSRKITCIKDAVVALGFKAVEDIAVSIAVFENLGRKGSIGRFSRRKFWEHSLGVGYSAKIIAGRVSYPRTDLAFLAGLLHDLGKVVLDQYASEKFIAAIDLTYKDDILLKDAEQQVLNSDHAEIGRWLAEQWGLADNLCEAIGYHHAPQPDKIKHDFELTAIVHLSDIFTRAIGIGNGGDNRIPEIQNEVVERYQGLMNCDLSILFQEISLEMEKAKSFLQFLK